MKVKNHLCLTLIEKGVMLCFKRSLLKFSVPWNGCLNKVTHNTCKLLLEFCQNSPLKFRIHAKFYRNKKMEPIFLDYHIFIYIHTEPDFRRNKSLKKLLYWSFSFEQRFRDNIVRWGYSERGGCDTISPALCVMPLAPNGTCQLPTPLKLQITGRNCLIKYRRKSSTQRRKRRSVMNIL